MAEIWNGLIQAFRLLITLNTQVREIVLLSLGVSGTALVLSTLLGVPLGSWLALSHFSGRKPLIAVIYTGMGLPPVVVGLFVYLFLSQAGPLAFLNWLFTPAAMVIAQVIIALPLVAGFTMAAVKGVPPEVVEPLFQEPVEVDALLRQGLLLNVHLSEVEEVPDYVVHPVYLFKARLQRLSHRLNAVL